MDTFNIQSLYDFWSFVEKYRTYVLALVIGIGVISGGGVYYYLSSLRYEASAQEVLADVLSEIDRAYQNPELWAELETASKIAWNQFKRSRVAPYFLLAQAEAMAQQQKLDEAITLLDTALQKFSTSSSFYYLFVTKKAGLLLSDKEVAVQQKGIDELIALAHNEKNQQKEQAQYLLAQYYQLQGNDEKAHEWWQLLAKDYREEEQATNSPWAMLAHYYLQQGQ